MNKNLSIEYCTSWGYLSKAVSLTEEILNEYKNDFDYIKLIPSSGGVFEVVLNDELIYSKKKTGEFPKFEELDL